MFANPPRVSWKRSPTNLHGISRAVWEGGALSDKSSKMTFDWRSRELTQRKSDRKCRNFSGFDPRPSILPRCVTKAPGRAGDVSSSPSTRAQGNIALPDRFYARGKCRGKQRSVAEQLQSILRFVIQYFFLLALEFGAAFRSILNRATAASMTSRTLRATKTRLCYDNNANGPHESVRRTKG